MPPISDRVAVLKWKLVLCAFVWLGLLSACGLQPPAANNIAPVTSIRVVMDDNYPPYVFKDDQGRLQGILVDQWDLWQARTGVEVQITALPWGEALKRMTAGEFDVIDTIFFTTERAANFDFTEPYARIDVNIFFQNNISGIADAAGLKGFRVAVKKGDANIEYLNERGVSDMSYYDSYEEIVQAAAAGAESIFVIDKPPALFYLYKFDIQNKFNYSEPLYGGEFHRAVLKGNKKILDLVNRGFSSIRAGEYKEIDRHWFGSGYDDNLRTYLPWAGLVAFVTLIVILVLFAFNRVLQSRVQKRTLELSDALHDLQKSETRFRESIEFLPVPINISDSSGKLLIANRKFIETYGYTLEDIPSVDAWVLRAYPDPVYRAWVLDQWGKDVSDAASDGSSTRLRDYKVICKDGSLRYVEISMHAVGDLMVASFNNVTERKQAEQALRDSEAKYRALVEQLPMAVYTNPVDAPDYTLYVSPQIKELLGYSSEEWSGNPHLWSEVLHPEDQPLVNAVLDRMRLNDEPGFVEYRVIAKDGRMIWLRDQSVLIRDAEGQPKFWQGFMIDVSEQKRTEFALRQSEAEVRQLNAELERRVVERTTQLEQANKELETFAYSVSHDLRAPLRAINGFSHMLAEDFGSVLDEKGARYIERIVNEGTHMGQLIDALLNLSRMSRAEIHRETVDMRALALLVNDELRQANPNRQVDFIVADEILARGDVRLLRILLENILGNAWKFTSRREKALIEFGVDKKDGETVYFVRDDGAGFDMAFADKLFGAFQRLHRADEFEGTGIGLATVKRIINRHGGRVWAQSIVGQGTTFFFTFSC